jgi:protein AATF/BFR2
MDMEIFDDGDYYQQLLKEFIDSRMNESGEMSSRLEQLKQLQKKKSKKNVDTKASKGRKIRYEIQEKIQNYMAPEPRGDWHEEMKEELFASLLGQNNTQNVSHEINDGFKIL